MGEPTTEEHVAMAVKMYRHVKENGLSIRIDLPDDKIVNIFTKNIQGFTADMLIFKNSDEHGIFKKAELFFIEYEDKYRAIIKREYVPPLHAVSSSSVTNQPEKIYVLYSILITLENIQMINFFIMLCKEKVNYLLCSENMKTGISDKIFCKSLCIPPIKFIF